MCWVNFLKKLIQIRKANGEYCFHNLWIYSFYSARILLHRFLYQQGVSKIYCAYRSGYPKTDYKFTNYSETGKILFKYKYKMLQSLPNSPLQTYQSVMNITLWQNKRDTQLFS